MPDLPTLIEDLKEDIKDAQEIIDADPGPLTEPDLSSATSELDQSKTHADDALMDPALVNLDPVLIGRPWPAGANNKVDLAVQWALDAKTAGTNQEKADLVGSVSKIINQIKNDIGSGE